MIIKISNYSVIIDKEDYQRVTDNGPWHCTGNPRGPYFAHDLPRPAKKKIYLHRFIVSAPKGFEVDHISGDKLDNRKCNLRICNRQQNAMNMKSHKDSFTGYKGVSFDKNRKKYKVEICFKGKRIFVGRYYLLDDAIEAYKTASNKFHGDFRRSFEDGND
jgi:hypothetical protein